VHTFLIVIALVVGLPLIWMLSPRGYLTRKFTAWARRHNAPGHANPLLWGKDDAMLRTWSSREALLRRSRVVETARHGGDDVEMMHRTFRVAVASTAVVIASCLTTLPASAHGLSHPSKKSAATLPCNRLAEPSVPGQATTMPCFRPIGPARVHLPSSVGHGKGSRSHTKGAKRSY
jgi:hypothetical protein